MKHFRVGRNWGQEAVRKPLGEGSARKGLAIGMKPERVGWCRPCSEASFKQTNADRMVLPFTMSSPWPFLPLRMSSSVISGCARKILCYAQFPKIGKPRPVLASMRPRAFSMSRTLFYASATPSVKWESNWPAAQGESPFWRALVPVDRRGARQH